MSPRRRMENWKELVGNTLTQETNDTRRIYNALVSFKAPQNATISVSARDADHARALIMEQMELANCVDPVITDIHLLSDILKADQELIASLEQGKQVN